MFRLPARIRGRRVGLALFAFVSLFTAACGGDNSDNVVLGTVSNTSTASTTTTSAPSSTATPFSTLTAAGLDFNTIGAYNGQPLSPIPGTGSGSRSARAFTATFSGNTNGSIRNLTIKATSPTDFAAGEVIQAPNATLTYTESFDANVPTRSWTSNRGSVTITRVTAGALEFDFNFIEVGPTVESTFLNVAAGSFNFSGHVNGANTTPTSSPTATTSTSTASSTSASTR